MTSATPPEQEQELAPEVTSGSGPALAAYQDTTWQTGVFRGLAIALLSASLIVAPVAVVRALTGWQLGYAFPLALFVCLMAVFNTTRLGRPEWRERRGLAFRLGEIVMILLLTRVAAWAFSTGWPTPSSFDLWLRHPAAFMDAQTWVTAILLLLPWALAISITADFRDLSIQADEVAARESREWGMSESHMRAFRPVSRSEIVGRFASRWAWAGVLFVILAGMSRVNVNQTIAGKFQLGFARLGLQPDVLVGLLCYFLAGLFLLSDARLAVLRGQWYNQRVDVARPVFGRWRWSSLAVVALMALVALLLPIGSTGPLARALEWLIALLVRAAMIVMFVVSALFSLLLYPLRWLFSQGNAAPPPAQESLQLPTQAEMASQVQIPDWLRGAVVWAVIAVVAGYLLFNFLRGRGLLQGPWLDGLLRLRYWWRARSARLAAAMQEGMSALRDRLRRTRLAEATLARPRRARLDRMGSREKVRYFYLRTVERAAERGRPRASHETPLEYERDLEQAWPDAETDVHELTEAFLDARYTPRPIDEGEAGTVQLVWRRVMKALRRPTDAQK
jgi:hypothetical protein